MSIRILVITLIILVASCHPGLREKISADTQGCVCFNGIGSTQGDEPVLKSTFSNGKSVVTCGFYDEEMKEPGLIMSEFNIFDCQTGNPLVTFGAMETCRIKESKDKIIIEELKYLPVGTNWNEELIQIGEQTVTIKGQDFAISDLVPKFAKVSIPKSLQTNFLSSIEKGGGIENDFELELSKLEVLSLVGNDDAWEILKNYEVFKNGKLDGAAAEQWKNAIANVEWVSKK